MIPRPTSPILLRKIGGAFDAIRRLGSTTSSAGAVRVGAAPSLLGVSLGFAATVLPLLMLVAALAAVLHLVAGSGAHMQLAQAHQHLGLVGFAGTAKIFELRAERDKKLKAANAALDKVQALAKTEGRSLSAEELAEQDRFDEEIRALDNDIKLEERRMERERSLGSRASVNASERPVPGSGPQPRVEGAHDRREDDPRRGFASHRDFIMAVMENSGLRSSEAVADERLRPLAVFDKDDRQAGNELAYMMPVGFTPRSVRAAIGSDEQGAYSDPYGGFAIEPSRIPGILQVGFEGDPTAGRTQPIPMATPTVEIMARVDKDHTSSVSGGFTVSRRAETAAAAASRQQNQLITMKAASLFGLAYATEEILTDSPVSFAAIIDSGFRSQFPAKILDEKIRGNGGNEFLGVLNSPAKITAAKESGQANGTITGNNIIAMAARCWNLGSAIWLANHDTRPQLATAQIALGTSGGMLLYQPSRQEGFPDMLWGRPVFYTEFANSLGAEGDLMLVDWTQFLEGLYQPLQSAESVHVRFINHERAVKFWLRNAGAPWWNAALKPAKSNTTLSPIVTLAAR